MSTPAAISARRHIRVLLSLGAPDGTTKFVNQIVDFRPAEESVVYFSWAEALFGKWDVFHVHWPEFLIRGKLRPVRAVRTVLFMAFLVRLAVLKRPVVRTLHNLQPHSPGGRLERQLLSLLDRRTTLFISLNSATPVNSSRRTVMIPHGHYVEQFRDVPRGAKDSSRMLYFGRIEPYKGVDDLLKVFGGSKVPGLTLRIVGRPTPELRAMIDSHVEADSRISASFGFVSDVEMVNEISKCGFVVLPYKEMHNSGVLLVALSLGRPVLAPRTAANELIEAEVGGEWVILFEGSLTERILDGAAQFVATTTRAERPEMPARDWRTVGESHYQAYLLALTRPYREN
jgi:beta-1,4-mannosyltransferase